MSKLGDLILNVEKDLQEKRKKVTAEVGSIIFSKEDNEIKMGICVDKNKYVTLKKSSLNSSVSLEEMYPVLEYYVGCVEDKPYCNDELVNRAKLKIGEDNVINSKYSNTIEFVASLLNEENIINIEEVKKKLLNKFGINKWLSTHNSEEVLELEKEKENLSKKNEIIPTFIKMINDKEDEDKFEEIVSEYEIEKELNEKNISEIISNLLKILKNKDEEKKNDELEDLGEKVQKDLEEKKEEINRRLEEAFENEKKISRERSENLEENIIKLLREIDNSNFKEIEDNKEKIVDLKNFLNEINDENLADIEKLEEKIEDLKKIETIKGYGKGWDLSIKDFEKLSDDFFKLQKIYENNKKLHRIIEKIGRKESEDEDNKILSKISKYGKEELLGVKLDNDIMRILPSELVYLSSKETENIFYLKYAEKKLLCYELIGHEKIEEENHISQEEKGAIIAILDTSGSMKGKRIKHAKAILLQAFKIARSENRDMKVMLFGSRNQIKEFDFSDNRDINNFIKKISGGFFGGTDYVTPLERSLEIVSNEMKYKYADIFLITDGECAPDYSINKKVQLAKEKLDLKIYTVIIDNSYFYTINKFSDEIICC